MTTSELDRLVVWAWLPGASSPVPAGVLEAQQSTGGGRVLTFAYGRTYRERGDPPLYLPELPVRPGRQAPPPGLEVAGVLRDAAPDAWGQQVVMRKLLGRDAGGRDTATLDLLTYLRHSGSDRAGSLDFQDSAEVYVPRVHDASLADLLRAADDVVAGRDVHPGLHDALTAGSSIGGARPKATLVDGGRHLIAKFSTLADPYPVIKAEAVAMHLAGAAGIEVAVTNLVDIAGRDVLLVERFDRGPGGTRRGFVSGLTMLGLHELAARHATYHDLADVVRLRFARRGATLRELFRRIVLNVLVGNTDDHARNHAAFYDGARDELELTPAYDICPQLRAGQEAAQAMAIGPDGARLAQLTTCLGAARTYDLSDGQAREVIDSVVAAVVAGWHDAADAARLTSAEREGLWGRQILNPFATYGYTKRAIRMPAG